MKIFAVNPIWVNSAKNHKNNKDRKSSNILQINSINLFKQNDNISFSGTKKISVKAIRNLIDKLLEENIHYVLSGNATSASVTEFRHFKTATKKTTFFLGGKKEEIIYKTDGITPNLKYKYQDNILTTIISYGQFGEKLFKEQYFKNGIKKTKTIYKGFASFPKIKYFYHKDGKTPKFETIFFPNSNKPKIIKAFDENGKITTKIELNENKEVLFKTAYDGDGNIVIFSEYSKNKEFPPFLPILQ